ncbi:MAG TPA: acyl-CoA thioesterase [Trebonia sp.]
MPPYYEYRHVVEFDEINHVGSVYHANFRRWAGRCLEMFLLEHASSVTDGLRGSLRLVTAEAGCERLAGVHAFKELSIRMRLAELSFTRIGLAFDYVRVSEGADELVGRGWQRITCLRDVDGSATPAPVPEPLRLALEGYAVVINHLSIEEST